MPIVKKNKKYRRTEAEVVVVGNTYHVQSMGDDGGLVMCETLHHQNSTLKLPDSVGHTDHKTDRHECVSGDGEQWKLCITKREYLPVAYT